jgi:hypothetical protein
MEHTEYRDVALSRRRVLAVGGVSAEAARLAQQRSTF